MCLAMLISAVAGCAAPAAPAAEEAPAEAAAPADQAPDGPLPVVRVGVMGGMLKAGLVVIAKTMGIDK